MMIGEIFNWLKKNLTFTQLVCYIVGIALIILALGFTLNDIKAGDWKVEMLGVQEWIFFGFGVIFLLIGILKNGTKKRHSDICKRLDKLEKMIKDKK